MSKVNVWVKDDRKMFIDENNQHIGNFGKPEEVKKVNKANGWTNTGEQVSVSHESVVQVNDPHAKAKYDAMIKAGLSRTDASNLSGYNKG